jgi:AraC-like DNA-binding protein
MTAPLGTPDAILRPSRAAQAITVDRVSPSPELAPFVDYYWYVGWRTGEPHRQQVVPQPRVHIAAEDGRLLVHGISREPFFRTLAGTGHVLGATFHAGGFRPLLRRGVGSVSGAAVPAGELFDVADRPFAKRILDGLEMGGMVEALEEYVRRLDPRPDPVVEEVRALVEAAESHHRLIRAEDLAAQASMSLRSLQRLFTEYVGVGPKWVVARFRILDAAAAAHSGEPVDWAELAIELGFSDQAHLTRAFTSVVGTPPAAYRRDA